MGVINAVAQFERELLIERTLSGQARARAQGVPFGRKTTFDEAGRAAVLAKLKDGANVAEVARALIPRARPYCGCAIMRRSVTRCLSSRRLDDLAKRYDPAGGPSCGPGTL